MKYLRKDDLKLVNPKFRNLVIEAWNNKERVPYGVIYLKSKKPTKKDIAIAKRIISALSPSV